MTNQEIFDKVCEHLMKQGCKSIENDTGLCRYRGPNGLKCAAGIFIPDELYNRNRMEGFSFDNISSLGEVHRFHAFTDAQLSFIAKLQGIHDAWLVTHWSRQLITFANANALNIPNCLL